MDDENNSSKLQLFDDSIQVAYLILGCIWIAKRFIRTSPPKKVECNHAARWCEIREKSVIQMKVVWKAVHQNNGRLLARVLSGVNVVATPFYKPLCEIHASR